MSKVCEIAKEVVVPIVEALGMEVVEIEYKKTCDQMNLTIYIDKEGGVSLDDCEKVHRAIDEPLDMIDPTLGATYVLNVSSPGIDRPLKTTKDFEKSVGKLVEVSLYAMIEKKKKFEGELISFDEDKITIKQDNDELTIQRKDIAVVRPAIKF